MLCSRKPEMTFVAQVKQAVNKGLLINLKNRMFRETFLVIERAILQRKHLAL